MNMAVVNAQKPSLQLVSSAGETYQNTKYQLEWSIGEIAVETLEGESRMLTQGFHQGPLEISTLINNTDFDINMTVYPNPTSNYIHLTTESVVHNLKVNITNLNGITIYSCEIDTSPWQFDFSNYASGTYILLVITKNQTLKSFKIIKY